MGTQTLLAVLCWLALSESSGEAVNPVNSLLVNDNVSEESAPRLYRSVPVGVYASAAPYAAFPYRVPAFLSGPIASASRNVPSREHGVFNNVNAYLRDSYGNRFVGTPQTAAYKTTIPQQYVQLQALPAHFAEPLAAAAPTYQIKQESPRTVFGSLFRSPFAQAVSSGNFAGGSQPYVYAQNIRAWVPSPAGHSQFQRLVASQQQSPSNRALYTQAIQKYQNSNSEPKFQRQEETPAPVKQVVIESNISQFKEEPSQNDHGNLKASSDTQRYTTIVNGKKTVIEVETKPSVPLLDLTLLEPLTFDNPVVPQVQHLLPRINQATYKTLPEFNNQQKKTGTQNQKAKSKKKQKRPIQTDDDNSKQVPEEPTITVKDTPDESPEIFYEINTPNHKETYKEQTVSYNKETNKEPVTYSYDHKDEKKPVTYSFSNIVQEPVHYSYVSHDPNQNKEAYQNNPPQHLIYTFKPEDQKEEDHDGSVNSESEDTGSTEVSDDEVHQPHRAEYLEHHQESPRHNPQQPDKHHEVHAELPNHSTHHDSSRNEHQAYHEPSQRHKSHQLQRVEYQEHRAEPQHRGESLKHEPHQPKYEDYHEKPNRNEHHSHHKENQGQHKQSQTHKTHQPQRDHQEHYEHSTRHQSRQPQRIEYHERHEESPRDNPHQQQRAEHHEHRESPRHNANNPKFIEYQEHHDSSPRHEEHPKQEHQRHHQLEYKQSPDREEYHNIAHEAHKPSPKQYSQSTVAIKHEPELQAITQEYEEDIRLIPAQRPNAAIQVDPNQHIQKLTPNENPQPSPVPQHHQQDYREEQLIQPNPHVPPGPVPVIHETSKRIIIQEETPEEMHSHQEQMLAKMLEEQENNEEDFEKAYKNAAIGFPGYHKNSEEIEKDIYNPNSYGVSHDQDYDVDHAPFQEYQAEGDEFPKTARLSYKDSRDDIKNDYYLDYAVHKPESIADRYRKKKEYYKLYENYKPEKYFADEKKEKQKDKYTLAPSFSFNSEPAKEENKNKPYFAQYKAAPPKYQYSYSKPKPRDNSAFASGPYQSYTSKTHFVEPQFQYGFEPIAIPRLLDSELAAMASNDSPESDKPGMRKKVYKENWYIKKTSTAGGDAAS